MYCFAQVDRYDEEDDDPYTGLISDRDKLTYKDRNRIVSNDVYPFKEFTKLVKSDSKKTTDRSYRFYLILE